MKDLKISDLEAHKRLEARLARIEGQIHGVRDMIQREVYFTEIVQQLTAVREALNKVFAEIIADAAEELLTRNEATDSTRHLRLMELVKIIAKYG